MCIVYSTILFLKILSQASGQSACPARRQHVPRLVTMVMLRHTTQQLSLLHLRPADSPLCRASIAGSHAPSNRPLAKNSAPRPPLVSLNACLCVLAALVGKRCNIF